MLETGEAGEGNLNKEGVGLGGEGEKMSQIRNVLGIAILKQLTWNWEEEEHQIERITEEMERNTDRQVGLQEMEV